MGGEINDDGKNTQATVIIEGIDKPEALLNKHEATKSGCFYSLDLQLADGANFDDAAAFVKKFKSDIAPMLLKMTGAPDRVLEKFKNEIQIDITKENDGKTPRVTGNITGTNPMKILSRVSIGRP